MLEESDARMAVTATLEAASVKRLSEAGILLTENDPLDIAAPVYLSSAAGVGSSRRGSWEGRVLSGERGLASALILASNVLSSPRDAVRGAALAWAALLLPANASTSALSLKASSIIKTWCGAIRASSTNLERYYVRQGVCSEVAEIITWLRSQNFHLPVEEEIPHDLLIYPAPPTEMLEGSVNRLVLNRFTHSTFHMDELRSSAFRSGSFPFSPPPPGTPQGRVGNPQGMRLQLFDQDLSDIDELSVDSQASAST
mmetsp:Transcript_18530/g.45915  ORF Transcript_18530/g.45915 Transcript_18530/m.45915 type:complete len:256 (-) Transcript_18530:78-845(-)|eukprot:CAMPEP_0116080132 /NCGR_PEP_ID=MMETSP0327-20121206/1512_1 /TAXON_ID=44447 /ORGANISM="Pseudo-nitzschia delicatissima, Strain B596" /LENGTH=255 /DNA_ID=CAMNT_0003570803 /DNA_START=64 /DNA_END=831 /DNA_ORIENTATION=-